VPRSLHDIVSRIAVSLDDARGDPGAGEQRGGILEILLSRLDLDWIDRRHLALARREQVHGADDLEPGVLAKERSREFGAERAYGFSTLAIR
jgi:hypothetical protein